MDTHSTLAHKRLLVECRSPPPNPDILCRAYVRLFFVLFVLFCLNDLSMHSIGADYVFSFSEDDLPWHTRVTLLMWLLVSMVVPSSERNNRKRLPLIFVDGSKR